MKTIIYIEYDSNTAETRCRFADEFSEMSKNEQLEIAQSVVERMSTLASSLEAIIARSPSSNS